MKARDNSRLKSLMVTKMFCEKHNSVWSTEPTFNADYNTYNSLLNQITDLVLIHALILRGYTIDKAEKGDKLIEALLHALPRISIWARASNHNRPDILAVASIAESTLDKMKDTLLLSFASSIAGIISKNPSIVSTFISLPKYQFLTQSITEFSNVIQLPKVKISERVVANRMMVSQIAEIMKFRREVLLIDAKLFRESNPEFLLGFIQSVNLNSAPTRRRALQGTIHLAGTNIGIANVHIIVEDTGAKTRTGEKGNFMFKSIPEGGLTLLIVKYGFKPLVVKVFHNKGERTDVLLQIEKVDALTSDLNQDNSLPSDNAFLANSL